MKKAKYREIAEWLEDGIKRNRFREAGKIPTEKELMSMFSVSRDTVRKAVALVAAGGSVRAVQGSGIYIDNRRQQRKIAYISYVSDKYIFPEIDKGLFAVLQPAGMELLIFHTDYSTFKEEAILKSCLDSDVDGIILTALFRDNYRSIQKLLEGYREKRKAVVLLDSLPEISHAAKVLVDDFGGGVQAADILSSGGSRSFLVVFGMENPAMLKRRKGFLYKLSGRTGIRVKELPVSLTDPGSSLADIAARRLVGESEAVFFANDQLALECVKMYPKLMKGKAFCGFDNSALSDEHGFSTFAHPQENAGRIAARFLLNIFDAGTRDLIQESVFKAVFKDRGTQNRTGKESRHSGLF